METLAIVVPVAVAVVFYVIGILTGLFKNKKYWWISVGIAGLLLLYLGIYSIAEKKFSFLIFLLLVLVIGAIVKYFEYKKLK